MWQGRTSRGTHRIVPEPNAYETQVRHGRTWVYVKGVARGERLAVPLGGTRVPTGNLRLILQDDGRVESAASAVMRH